MNDEGGRRQSVDSIIDEVVKRHVARIPPAKDGYTPVKGKDYRDGQDVDPEAVRLGIEREVARLPKAKPGDDGDDGLNGWSPLLAVESDGERRVLRVVGWVGGEGETPPAGFYLATGGRVDRASDATDIRGPAGKESAAQGGGASDAGLRKLILKLIAEQGSAVDSVNGQTGAVVLGAEDVGADPTGTAATAVAAHAAEADPHSVYILKTQKGAANGVATLGADQKVPTDQLPALAITDTDEVASEAAMLALDAEKGDVAVRTDENKSYILATDDPTQVANWKLLRTPTDVVQSVNGETGAITLDAADVGAQPADTELTALAGLTSAADKLPYFSGAGSAALADLTSYARTLLGAAGITTILPLLGIQAKVVASPVVTTQATLQDITGLSFAIGANETWAIFGAYRNSCNNTGGIKFGINGPLGATPVINYIGGLSSGTAFTLGGNVALVTETSAAFNTFNGTAVTLFAGTMAAAGTGGNSQMQFDSDVAGQSSTIAAGSVMLAVRIA